MNKKLNLFIRIMTLIGILTTAVCLCIIFRERIKESFLFRKFFAEEEPDLELPLEQMVTEEEKDPEAEAEEDEEKPAPKARRGYTSLAL